MFIWPEPLSLHLCIRRLKIYLQVTHISFTYRVGPLQELVNLSLTYLEDTSHLPEKTPLHVNPKQFVRRLRRGVTKQRPQKGSGSRPRSRGPYSLQCRHKYATKKTEIPNHHGNTHKTNDFHSQTAKAPNYLPASPYLALAGGCSIVAI